MGPTLFSSVFRGARATLGDDALCGKDGFAGASVKFGGVGYRHARHGPRGPFIGVAAKPPPNAKQCGGVPGRRQTLRGSSVPDNV